MRLQPSNYLRFHELPNRDGSRAESRLGAVLFSDDYVVQSEASPREGWPPVRAF